MDVATLGIVVELKDGQLVARKLDEIAVAADRTEKQAKSLTSAFKGLGATFGVGLIARAGLQNIIEAQAGMAQLENVVRATGGTADRTTRQLTDLAAALQSVTTYSDDAVMDAMTRLLAFTSVQGAVFDRATKAIVDFATAYRVDVVQAAETVGKALEYPANATAALARQGFRFSEDQQRVIEALMETGRVAEAQAIVLSALEEGSRGAAAAARDTLGGALKALVNDFGDLFEVSRDGTSGVVSALRGLDTAIVGMGQHMGAVVTVAELLAGVYVGRLAAGFAAAKAEAVATFAQVARGNAVMLDSATAVRGQAAAAVEAAHAERARAVAVLESAQADRVAIATSQALYTAQLRAANARLAGAVSPAALAPIGGAAVAREAQAQAAAAAAQSTALRNLAQLGGQAANVERQLTAATAALAEAETAAAAAATRQAEAIAATSLAARAATAATSALSGVMAALGGPIGVAMLAAIGINAALDKYLEHVTQSVEMTENQQRAYEAALATERKRNASQKEAAERAATEATEIKRLTGERQIEIDRLHALNAAYGQGDVALAKINARYDRMAQDAKDAVDHYGKERDALQRMNAAREQAVVKAAEMADAQRTLDKVMGDVRASRKQQADEQMSWAKQVKEGTDKLHEETDAADRQLAALRDGSAAYQDITDAIEAANRAKAIGLTADDANYAAVVAETKALIEKNRVIKEQADLLKSLAASVDEATKGLKEKLDDMLREVADRQEKYQKDMQNIWRDGVGKIVTDGTKSFHDFFEDVLQMFSKLMKRMEDEGTASGGLYKLLGIGSAAITGGVAGYSVGNATGSAAAGMGSGILTGAMSGAAFGPWGVAAGVIAGAAGGLLGAAKAHSEAAKQLREAAESFRDNMKSYVAAANGDDLGAKLAAEDQRYAQLYRQLDELYAKRAISSDELVVQMNDLIQAHETLTERIKHEAEMARARGELDLRVQILQAQGLDAAASELQRTIAMWEAINSGKGPEVLALLQQLQDIQRANEETARAEQAAADAAKKVADEQAKQRELLTQLRDAAQAMADDLQRQTDAQQRTVDGLRNVVSSLAQWRQSLDLNPALSILSPKDQADQAMAAYRALVAKAMTGDQAAAAGLQSAATTALNANEKYNAHGPGYVDIYREIMASSGAVQDQFGAQLSTEERMLAELQKQTAQMQHQVDLLNQQLGVQKSSAQLDYVNAILNNAYNAPAQTDAYGNTNSPVNSAYAEIVKMFPGLQMGLDQRSGRLYFQNYDFSSPLEYYTRRYGNMAPEDVPDSVRQVLHDGGVPGFAAGTDLTTAGMFVAGEGGGPELVFNRGGSAGVINNRNFADALAKAVSGSGETVAELKAQTRELKAAVRVLQAIGTQQGEKLDRLSRQIASQASQQGLAGEVHRSRRT